MLFLPLSPLKIQVLIYVVVVVLPFPAALPQSSGPFISTSEHDRWKVEFPSLQLESIAAQVNTSKKMSFGVDAVVRVKVTVPPGAIARKVDCATPLPPIAPFQALTQTV